MKKFAREEGEAIGESRGKQTTTLEIATSMLKNNYSINEIRK